MKELIKNRCLVVRSLLALPTLLLLLPTNQAMAASSNLSELDGSNGFSVIGFSGISSISVNEAGDVNGDGISDLIIGSSRTRMNGNSSAGASYVLFGSATAGNTGLLDVSDLDGSNGFVLSGIDEDDYSGYSVSAAGDINGDGLDDLVIGAYGADHGDIIDAGETYVVFGAIGLGNGGVFSLSALDGVNGFVLKGIDRGDLSGRSVSTAGDINGDGLDDLVIGASSANPDGKLNAGETFVVFGADGLANGGVFYLSDLDGNNGFVLNGIDEGDRSGSRVSAAGDINDYGVDDLLVAALYRDSDDMVDVGEGYILFGKQSLGSSGAINLSDFTGSDGIVLKGVAAFDAIGSSISAAGDFNGDGVGDLMISSAGAGHSGKLRTGATYLIFGGINVGNDGNFNLSELDGSNGFTLYGTDWSDYSGISISSAGDFNGDGADDLLIGAFGADPNSRAGAGESYVVYGGGTVGNSGEFYLSELNGSNGFVLNGVDSGDNSGFSVSAAGDFNDDGRDDLIIGAPGAYRFMNRGLGAAYVVFDVALVPTVPTVEINLMTSCLSGDGRVDLNIVNTRPTSSVYELDLQGLAPRLRSVSSEDWGRIRITGRPDGTYAVLVKRDNEVILSETLSIDCDSAVPTVSSPEITLVNACRSFNGQVFFQMVNPSAAPRAYVIEFEGVANRSTTAAAYGQALRGTTGRRDGIYNYMVRTGSTVLDSGVVEIACD